MAACWKHDISRNEGEELPTLWRQRGGQHVWNVCHINEGKTILAVACRPSILRCPTLYFLLLSSAEAAVVSVGFAGFAHK